MAVDKPYLRRLLPIYCSLRTIWQRCQHISQDVFARLIESREPEYLKRMLPGKLIDIPTSRITSEYAFSLAPDGWNYIHSLVADCATTPDIDLDQTTFYHFFQDDQIRAVCDLNQILFLHDPGKRSNTGRFYFGTYPWGHWTQYTSAQGGKPWGHAYDRQAGTMTRDLHGYRNNPWYQPGDRYPLEIEFEGTRALYHAIQHGYKPHWYGSFPTVILMLRNNGDWRAVRDNGHHRLSILSHLGYDIVSVVIPKTSVGIVHEAEVDQWYYVKSGHCTTSQALEIFNAYFELNGKERFDYLGLSSKY